MEAAAAYTTCDYLRRYLTGFFTENGFVLTDKNGTRMFTDSRYTEAARKCLAGTDIEVVETDRHATAEDILSPYQTVAIPFSQTFYPEYKRLEKTGVTLVDDSEAFTRLMSVKNESEIAAIQKACTIAEEGFLRLLPDIKEGMTETAVAALLEYQMRSLGAYSTSFDTIVAFGANAAVPHHETDNTRLRFGDEILIDFGCKVDGYCSDITRTFLFGDDKKHGEFKELYAHVLTAHNLVQEKLVSGMTAEGGDAIARDYLRSVGLASYFTHSVGHGIGLNIHEFPFLRPKGTEVLTDGMVFSDEPGVYFEGKLGIRIEDSVTLQNGRVKSFMNKTQKELIIL